MRKLMLVVAVCGVLLFSTGCAYRTPVMPPAGVLFSDFKAPLGSEYTGQSVETKQGQASSFSVLCLFAFGDCSLQAAAKEGRLSTITHCDYSYLNVMGVFQKFTIIAHGR